MNSRTTKKYPRPGARASYTKFRFDRAGCVLTAVQGGPAPAGYPAGVATSTGGQCAAQHAGLYSVLSSR